MKIRLLLTTLSLPMLSLALGTAVVAEDPYERSRQDMVDFQLRDRGIRQGALLEAMASVPRHLFVPPESRERAYLDEPLPTQEGEAILQPYISALMIELLELDGSQRVLEIGTGTGYDAAVLSHLASEVYTVEISEPLAAAARERLERLGFENVMVIVGDGNLGLPEEAPFDAILLTAAPDHFPHKLVEQLEMGGRMVVAVGGAMQELTAVRRTPTGLLRSRIEPVRISKMSAVD